MKGQRLCFALAVLLILAVALPAIAQYPPNLGEVRLRDVSGNVTTAFAPGEMAEITASDLLPDTTYDILLSQSPAERVGSGGTDADGSLRTVFRVPRDAKAGPATLTLDPRGVEGGDRSMAIRIVAVGVKAESGVPTSRPLDLYVGIGVALLVAGAMLMTFLWRRRVRHRVAEEAPLERVSTM